MTNYQPNLLHIFGTEGDPLSNGLTPLETIHGNVTFYKYDTRDFQTKNIYSWNDGTYFGRLDFLTTLFNLNLPDDVWRIEVTLKGLLDTTPIHRWGFDRLYFKASNLHGKNTNKVLTPENNIKRFFGELESWDSIANIVRENV